MGIGQGLVLGVEGWKGRGGEKINFSELPFPLLVLERTAEGMRIKTAVLNVLARAHLLNSDPGAEIID